MTTTRRGPRRRFSPQFEQFLGDLQLRFGERYGRATLDVPRGAPIEWSLNGDAITCRLPRSLQGKNLQTDACAAPFFALALAYWSADLGLGPRRARVELWGTPVAALDALRHARRARFVLDELATLLPERLEVVGRGPEDRWAWPGAPVLNREQGARDALGSKREHRLEMQLAGDGATTREFPGAAGLSKWARQLPLGLFEGVRSMNTAWTPRGASQVDLWATSDGGRTLHLFELKAERNAKVGILPEAFYYARFVDALRRRDFQGGGDGASAARKARAVKMWLIGPSFHPLVFREGRSPLAWVNEASGDGPTFGIVPFETDSSGITKWLPDKAWP